MKALFAAPDMVVLASAVSSSETKDEFYKNIKKYGDGDYVDNVKDIISNPANLRFGWVKFEKSETDVDFFSNLSLLTSNNSYTASEKEIIMTHDSVFVNINLLDVFKKITEQNMKDSEHEPMEIDLASRIDYKFLSSMAENMYNDGKHAVFHEIVSTDSGPQMFMLSGEFTNDTWSVLETIGPVARKPVLLQESPSIDKRYPGFLIIFGLGMSALAQIASQYEDFPEHIKRDFESLPRKQENSSGDDDEKDK